MREFGRVEHHEGGNVMENFVGDSLRDDLVEVSQNRYAFDCSRSCLDKQQWEIQVCQAEEKRKSFSLASL